MGAHIQQTRGVRAKGYVRQAGLALISAVVLACAPLESSIGAGLPARRPSCPWREQEKRKAG